MSFDAGFKSYMAAAVFSIPLIPLYSIPKSIYTLTKKVHSLVRDRLGKYEAVKGYLENSVTNNTQEFSTQFRKNPVVQKVIKRFGPEILGSDVELNNLSNAQLATVLRSPKCRVYMDDKIFHYKKGRRELKKELVVTALSLIPLLGGIVLLSDYLAKRSLKLAAGNSVDSGSIPNDLETLARLALYPGMGEKALNTSWDKNRIKIEVPLDFSHAEAGFRQLDAIHFKTENVAGPTVVIYHGNGMTCDDTRRLGLWYFSQGYNVLMPTIGGYSGSSGVVPSEASNMQDVEAVKEYLHHLGVREVGYHGISLGGSLALFSATGPSKYEKIKTVFVVADQTFTSAADAGENLIRNTQLLPKSMRRLARTVMTLAAPAGQEVDLGQDADGKRVVAVTTGLDNRSYAQQLKAKRVPLLVIQSTCDDFMGKDKKKIGQKEYEYATGFGDELLEARYDVVNESNTILLPGWGHATDIANRNSTRCLLAKLKLQLLLEKINPHMQAETVRLEALADLHELGVENPVV